MQGAGLRVDASGPLGDEAPCTVRHRGDSLETASSDDQEVLSGKLCYKTRSVSASVKKGFYLSSHWRKRFVFCNRVLTPMS